uniref:Protein kinase domain-containing protein n=1 Tax=Strongyloides venezuelensis TaxID=75913 RepID=A0A0K0FGM9_STRVS
MDNNNVEVQPILNNLGTQGMLEIIPLNVKYKLNNVFNDEIIANAYKGIVLQNNKDVIIKFISKESYGVIQDVLQSTKKFVSLNSLLIDIYEANFFNESKYYYIAMDGSKKNLQELVDSPKQIPFLAVHCIAIKMLLAIEFLHLQGFIHDNIQMSSFWISNYDGGQFPRNISVILGDYELSYRKDIEKFVQRDMCQDLNLKTIYTKRSVTFSKNPIYCSLSHHKGKKSSMKSDLESWYYIFIHLLENDLPWKNIYYDDYYIECQKEAVRKPDYYFFSNTHERLAQCIVAIDNFKENEIPNYKLFRGKILRVIRNFNANKNVTPQYSEKTTYIVEAEKYHYNQEVTKAKQSNKSVSKTISQNTSNISKEKTKKGLFSILFCKNK